MTKQIEIPATDNSNNTVQENERKRTRSLLIFFILFLISFIFIVYYFSEIKKEFNLLEKVSPWWLFAAVSGQFLTYFFTAIIYRNLLRTYQLKLLPPMKDLFKSSIISLFFNQVMPSAGISGNTFFFNFLLRFNITVTKIIALILAELLIFYAAMEAIILVLLIACLFFVNTPGVFKITLTCGLIIYFVFSIIMTLAGRNEFLARLYRKIKRIRIFKKMFEGITSRIDKQEIFPKDEELRSLLRDNKVIVLKTISFQLLVIAADAFTIFALFYGLGLPVSAFIIILVLICTKIISILPFLPGALILYESSMSFFFANMGVAVGIAVIVTLLYRLLSFWLPIPLGLFLYRKWQKQE